MDSYRRFLLMKLIEDAATLNERRLRHIQANTAFDDALFHALVSYGDAVQSDVYVERSPFTTKDEMKRACGVVLERIVGVQIALGKLSEEPESLNQRARLRELVETRMDFTSAMTAFNHLGDFDSATKVKDWLRRLDHEVATPKYNDLRACIRSMASAWSESQRREISWFDEEEQDEAN